MNYYPQQSPITMPILQQPSLWGMGPKINVTAKDVPWEKIEGSQKRQQTWVGTNSILTTVGNTTMGIVGGYLNYALQNQQFKTMREGMNLQYKLGLAGVNLELHRNTTAQQIQEDCNKTALKIAKLNANMQVRMAQVNQSGLTRRAEIFAAYNTFSSSAMRSPQYYYGNPYSSSVM